MMYEVHGKWLDHLSLLGMVWLGGWIWYDRWIWTMFRDCIQDD